MRRIATAIAVALLALPAVARAQGQRTDGNYILTDCTELATSSNRFLCMRMLRSQITASVWNDMPAGKPSFCPPTGNFEERARDVIVEYLQIHPAERADPLRSIIPKALKPVFPCP